MYKLVYPRVCYKWGKAKSFLLRRTGCQALPSLTSTLGTEKNRCIVAEQNNNPARIAPTVMAGTAVVIVKSVLALQLRNTCVLRWQP
jgi:hypothetical protein